MKIKYFAFIRERLGIDEEEVDLPDHVNSLGTLLEWQTGRGEEFEAAFADPDFIRVALNQKLENDPAKSLDGITEIAIFPPMTGG